MPFPLIPLEQSKTERSHSYFRLKLLASQLLILPYLIIQSFPVNLKDLRSLALVKVNFFQGFKNQFILSVDTGTFLTLFPQNRFLDWCVTSSHRGCRNRVCSNTGNLGPLSSVT